MHRPLYESYRYLSVFFHFLEVIAYIGAYITKSGWPFFCLDHDKESVVQKGTIVVGHSSGISLRRDSNSYSESSGGIMKDSPSFWSRLDAVDILVSVTSLAILVVIVSVQVFCRYVLQNSLDWTEELARYLLIWAVLFGCSYAMKEEAHLEMSILRSMVGQRLEKIIHVFACLMCLVFCVIMINAGMESIENIRWSEQTTPAMQIPAWIIWLAMPVGFALMGIHAVLRVVRIIRRPQDRPTFNEDRADATL